MLWRKAAGRPASTGGRDHISHRLVSLGMWERRAVVMLYGVSVISGRIACLLYIYGFSYVSFVIGLLAVGTVLLELKEV